MTSEEVIHQKTNPVKGILRFFLFIGIIFTLLPFLLLDFFKAIRLRFIFSRAARHQGKFIIFVYSDSPNWKAYIEENILPHIQERAFILNWSERKQWDKSSWIIQGFHRWGGDKEFNPVAIVFCSLINIQVFRFNKAFHEFKNGKFENLQETETDFIQLINSIFKK